MFSHSYLANVANLANVRALVKRRVYVATAMSARVSTVTTAA